MRGRPVIALLTDFGNKDGYLASMKGVLLTHCPDVQCVDISHEIPPFAIGHAAATLLAVSRWFPRHTVFLCVVDPGVGTRRFAIAAHADEHYFVGPDNGLFAPVLDKSKRRRIVRLTQSRYWMKPVSQTFHGRDIFAPVAAHLANRKPLSALGTPTRWIQSLPAQELRRYGRLLIGRIVAIDHFGNLITNLPGNLISTSSRKKASIGYKRRTVPVVSSYAFAGPNNLSALVNSAGMIELVLRERSAAHVHQARIGDTVRCRLS